MEPPQANAGTHSTPESWATTCQNCGTPLDGRFCSQCGQRAIPPRPTVRELVGDAWNELVGWDGKLARTLRLLLCRPGELTLAALEGRRMRYVSPVRLYLLCSLLYFLIAAGVPNPDADVAFDIGVGVGIDESRTSGDAVIAKAIASGVDSLSAQERELLEAEIARAPAVVRPLLRSSVADFSGFQRRVLELLPQALFLLIPVLALVLALFYRRRNYPEHLYAALHLQSFVFLVLTLVAFANYTRSIVVDGIATALAAIVIVVYAVVAQRRGYGGPWGMTVVKAMCIGALYGVLWSLTSLAVAVWVAGT